MGRPALTDDAIADFRRRACDAAMALYAEHAEVSLRQLAAVMGISHTAPYRYFESKEDLFMATRAAAYRRFAAWLDTRLLAEPDLLERIRVLCRSYFEYAITHTPAFRLMFQLGQPRPEAWPDAYAAGVEAWSLVRRTTQAAIDAGRLQAEPNQLAHLLWASVHGVASLALAHRLTVGVTGESLIEPMVDAICRAHRPPEDP
jgi:AcrR family transcriptional regulator